MIVITLIVLAAARLSRREQQQSLDRQLSTQAFYAAESGVNDASKAIESDLASGGTLLDADYTTDCQEFISPAVAALNPDLGASVKYSCLLVDPTPTTWEGNASETSRIIPIQDKNGLPVTSVEISWQDKDGRSNFGCPLTFPAATSWGCETPILRFDIVPTTVANRNALNASQMTGFLIPSSAGATVSNISYAASGGVAVPLKQTVTCNLGNSPKFCRARITGLIGTKHSLRIKSIYGSSAVTVSGHNVSGDKIELVGAQVVIDSTGKANDILRRIQVRRSLSGEINLPEFAIESSNNICKQLEVNGSGTTTSVNPECPLN
ncbi:pilus assembly PilX N-terminal domain-containing protein [Candidatus Saccharibacteria bacterium]|nr:pilus assembly PilX N-terminal domain-containing protein [Candidatus Saccharibacteria bacterium]